MVLPTPPGTSHRKDKENKSFWPTRIAWNDDHEIYTLTPTGSRKHLAPSNAPVKSILKKTAYEPLPYVEESRETTPEPSDPLADLHYLDSPVATIIAANAALRDLVESYSVLAARLRACVSGNTDADASWPLFQPIRKHRDALVQAMCRDLGRALESPPKEKPGEEEARFLPSPEKSPKKRGMTAEAVKYARDLCTTCHSVLKLLSAVFTLPAIFGIFEDGQLRELLTAVLAIPLAPELPTPNARKTYALAIWLMQYQRLPADILLPARDRIAYALRRGIEGELGKEGKKGATSDGLKAIHDLSICYPTVFVPAFVDLLPSVFPHLLAPTLVLRMHACQALGGFAYGLTSLPSSTLHSRVASHTASLLTSAPLGTPSQKPNSPSKDPMIIRTLRTTLSATDPKHVAQGPVWALSILSYFIVMLGPQAFLDERISKCIVALSSLATRHPKSSIRTFACLTWRCMTWAYFRPLPAKMSHHDESQEEVRESDDGEEQEYTEEEMKHLRQRMLVGWKMVSSIVEMGAGVSTIGALLGPPTSGEKALKRALTLLEDMSKRGGLTCQEALLTVAQLVSRFRLSKDIDPDAESPEDYEWCPSKLLPLPLFSSNPGLLTADYNALAPLMRGIVAECPHVDEVRTLGLDEVSAKGVFDNLIQIWTDGLHTMQIQWGEEFPAEVLNIWSCMLNAKVIASRDDEDELSDFAHYVVHILASILKDNKLDFSAKKEDDDQLLRLSSPAKSKPRAPRALPVYRWKPALKLLFVRQLWLIVKTILPASSLPEPAEALLALLDISETNLVVDTDMTDDVRAQWASLCAEVAYHCSEQEFFAFWGLGRSKIEIKRKAKDWTGSVRSFVWSHFVDKWREEPSKWESSAILLGVPFLEPNTWDMSSEDLDEWHAFLRYTTDRALDFGLDLSTVLDHIASTIHGHRALTVPSAIRVADLLLSSLDISEARSLPSSLFELIASTLTSSYPPSLSNKVPSVWLLRTVTRAIDACPTEFVESLLDIIQDGVRCWVVDDQTALSNDEFLMDVLPIYQTALVSLMSLPAQAVTIEKFAPLVESAFCQWGRINKTGDAVQAFTELWESGYSVLEAPAGGWSDKIARCLAEAGVIATAAEVTIVTELVDDEHDDEEVENQLCAPVLEEVTSSPVFPSSVHLSLDLADPFAFPTRLDSPSPKRPRTDFLEPPSPPVSAIRFTTPPPPYKPSSPVKALAPLVFGSPSRSSRSSPSRAPTTPKRRTPASARSRANIGEKENMSPLPKIASVAERIALRSPAPTMSVLRKRRFDEEDETASDPYADKRLHHDAPASFGQALQASPMARSLHVNMVDALPLVPASVVKLAAPASDDLDTTPGTHSHNDSPSKRTPWRRLFMDAVEVPRLTEAQRRKYFSLEEISSSKASSPQMLPVSRSLPADATTPTKKGLRRTRSLTKELGNDLLFERLATPSHRKRRAAPPRPLRPESTVTIATRKRKRDMIEEMSDDSQSISLTMSSPLRRLRDMDAIGSDDSIALATPSLTVGSSAGTPSSDDDPRRFVGLVTPHRVVSPSIRRINVLRDDDVFGEPASDDSNMSASPTTDRVARMKGQSRLPFSPLTPRLPTLMFTKGA